MIGKLINKDTFLDEVVCYSWEELVDIVGAPLLALNYISRAYLESVKETVHRFGGYMVLVDDVVFYHGRPEAGVNQIAMSLALLREPVYLAEKRIKAAFVFAAVDHDSHIKLLQELAMLLQDEEFLFLLRNHGDRDQIFRKLKEVERSNEI